MALKLVTPPVGTPVSLEELKSILGIEGTSRDAALTMLLRSATARLDGKDGILGRALLPQTWDLFLDEFPCGAIEVPLAPLVSVASITVAGQAQDLAGFIIDTNSEPGRIVPATAWPYVTKAPNAIRIRFTAGYLGEENNSPPGPNGVPDPIKEVIASLASAQYWSQSRDPSVKRVELPDIQTTDYWVGSFTGNAGGSSDAWPAGSLEKLAPYRMFWFA